MAEKMERRVEDEPDAAECALCDGSGECPECYDEPDQGCPTCDGSMKCQTCDGTGIVDAEE